MYIRTVYYRGGSDASTGNGHLPRPPRSATILAKPEASAPGARSFGPHFAPRLWIRPLPSPTGPDHSKPTCCLITLGCPKNLVDSERMLGLLRSAGYALVAEPEGADFVLVNTCGFIQSARDESLETIREMSELKRRGLTGGLIVAGCLAERDRESLLEVCPEIDQLVGVFARDEIAEAARRLTGGEDDGRTVFRSAPSCPLCDRDRLRVTARHVAYLKIAEGCDRRCAFCTIPAIRGRYASKPADEVIAEAVQLADDGVRELILIAQDTTYYGIDRGGRPQLAPLLARLNEVEGLEWIRLMYLYPTLVSEELIDVVAAGGKILPYLDVPLQHVNDQVLRRMNRGITRAQTEALVDRLRERIDGLVLRTTLIAGFPGETEEQFQELLQFVAERKFERLGVFPYSQEFDTPAGRLDGQVPEEVRLARADRLLAVQQQIAFAWNQSRVGWQGDVIIDRYILGEKNAYFGRSYAHAPDVDGVVYVTGDDLSPGRIVPCEIVAAREYDWIGAAIAEAR